MGIDDNAELKITINKQLFFIFFIFLSEFKNVQFVPPKQYPELEAITLVSSDNLNISP